MFFRRFYLESLGHASYLVGDRHTGRALVFDPRRDVDGYLAAAREAGVRIAYAADSHGHNDYLSGVIELRERAGAEPWGSAVAGLGYPHRPLRDREVVEIGDVGVEVWHTPGHTPEHISLLLYDRAVSADVPVAVLSGGSLLVGDLARPDLLGGERETRQAARALQDTARRLLTLPDHVQVYPTHVAGSLCGGRIGERLSTTIGYERLANPAISRPIAGRAARGAAVLAAHAATEPPRRGAAGAPPEPPALEVAEFDRRRPAGAFVLDVRSPEAFGGGHVSRGAQRGARAGLRDLGGDGAAGRSPGAARARPAGGPVGGGLAAAAHRVSASAGVARGRHGGLAHLGTAGSGSCRSSPSRSCHGRLDRDETDLLDVRQPAEWAGGHVPGAVHVTGAELPGRVGKVPDTRPLAVMCGSGYRSSVAASLLDPPRPHRRAQRHRRHGRVDRRGASRRAARRAVTGSARRTARASGHRIPETRGW